MNGSNRNNMLIKTAKIKLKKSTTIMTNKCKKLNKTMIISLKKINNYA